MVGNGLTDRQTDTHDNYRNPRCACTPRVNEAMYNSSSNQCTGSNYTTTVHNGQEFHTVVFSLITGISQSPGWWRDCPALQEEEGQVQGACLWTLPGMLFIGQSTFALLSESTVP